tara:strand:+ start:531 stop:794 length:264 start_codon:yes stop_codon:yes gene_type:complete
MNVYVLRYSLPWEDSEMISCYDTFQGAINRLAITQLHDNFDEGEKFTIECMEVTTEATSLERLNNIRKHYEEKKLKDANNNNTEESK